MGKLIARGCSLRDWCVYNKEQRIEARRLDHGQIPGAYLRLAFNHFFLSDANSRHDNPFVPKGCEEVQTYF
jgi:hypothetical protein